MGKLGEKSARPLSDWTRPAIAFPGERNVKPLRNQKYTIRLVSCAAREPHDPGVHIMKRTLLLTVAFGLFASVALAQIPPATTSAPSAQDFVNKVAISDMFEIQAESARAVEAGRCRHQAVRRKDGSGSSEDIERTERLG